MRKFRSFAGLLGFIAILLTFPGAVLAAAGAWQTTATITVATDNQVSAAVTLPGATSIGGPIKTLWIKVPTITSSTVYVQVAGVDNTSDFKDFYAFDNNTNVVLGQTAAGTGGITFQVPGDVSGFTRFRIKCGTAQAANRTFVIYGR